MEAVWKREKNKLNPHWIKKFKDSFEVILNLVDQAVLNIYYGDESGIILTPYIPYGYQPKGVQWGYPSQKKTVLNALGFLNSETKHLVTYNSPEKTNMSSEFFIKYLNDFISKLVQKKNIGNR